MVYYELIKITINAPRLAKIIINMVVWHHGLRNSIVTDRGSLFTSKFWSLLCYFLSIKRKLFTAFHLQTDGQTERQNSTIEANLQAFVSFKQNDWARLLSMAEFAYNNAKNVSTGYTPFKLNCGYHPHISFKKNTDSCSWSKTADELLAELRRLITVYWENFYHTQELQKQVHGKGVKLRSYAPNDKVWLNSKYIKTKQNWKLEAKFFRPFWVLYPISKEAYKLKLPRKWRVHNVFHVLVLGQNTIKKGMVSKEIPELDIGNKDSKEYKMKVIRDSVVYANKSESGYLPALYYLVV